MECGRAVMKNQLMLSRAKRELTFIAIGLKKTQRSISMTSQ
jgi:hypothetical protein